MFAIIFRNFSFKAGGIGEVIVLSLVLWIKQNVLLSLPANLPSLIVVTSAVVIFNANDALFRLLS